MSRPTVATINTQALRNNLAVVRAVAPHSRIWSVVKANAYGHGIDRVWQSFAETDGFALLNLEEAILLREHGWQKPILLLEGFFDSGELAVLDHHRLTTCVHSAWQIDALAAARLSAPLNIYLKMNSGMNRLGFAPQQAAEAWQRLRELKNVGEMTLMAHFADADNREGESITEPMHRIHRVAEALNFPPRSLANSAATLWHHQAHYHWVRPGIILYGASPSGRWQDIAHSGLQPAMTLSSALIATQKLKAGEGVGYGFCYRAAGEQRIGVVACGYADGYPRHAPTGTPVWVDGVLTQTVGRVSMDMLMVDLTPCPQADIGSVVELWGDNVRIDDVAASAGSVGYELMCALAPRVVVNVR